jgi:hypothetical protein
MIRNRMCPPPYSVSWRRNSSKGLQAPPLPFPGVWTICSGCEAPQISACQLASPDQGNISKFFPVDISSEVLVVRGGRV